MVAYSFKQRFVEPIRAGLGTASEPHVRPKLQTIRAVRRRHARPGEQLQLYRGMRTRQCFLIGRAVCTEVTAISLVFDDIHPAVYLGGSPYREKLNHFARADGFETWKQLAGFWEDEYPGLAEFEGVLIRWQPLRAA